MIFAVELRICNIIIQLYGNFIKLQMIVNECSRDELKDLFSSGLSDLIRDDEVKVHVVGVLDGFICERNLPIKQTVADSVIVNDLFEKGSYEALVFFGDAQ